MLKFDFSLFPLCLSSGHMQNNAAVKTKLNPLANSFDKYHPKSVDTSLYFFNILCIIKLINVWPIS